MRRVNPRLSSRAPPSDSVKTQQPWATQEPRHLPLKSQRNHSLEALIQCIVPDACWFRHWRVSHYPATTPVFLVCFVSSRLFISLTTFVIHDKIVTSPPSTSSPHFQPNRAAPPLSTASISLRSIGALRKRWGRSFLSKYMPLGASTGPRAAPGWPPMSPTLLRRGPCCCAESR